MSGPNAHIFDLEKAIGGAYEEHFLIFKHVARRLEQIMKLKWRIKQDRSSKMFNLLIHKWPRKVVITIDHATIEAKFFNLEIKKDKKFNTLSGLRGDASGFVEKLQHTNATFLDNFIADLEDPKCFDKLLLAITTNLYVDRTEP